MSLRLVDYYHYYYYWGGLKCPFGWFMLIIFKEKVSSLRRKVELVNSNLIIQQRFLSSVAAGAAMTLGNEHFQIKFFSFSKKVTVS